MTPEDVAAVEQSLRRLDGRMEVVAHSFYRRLFAAHPELRTIFTGSMRKQERQFATELHEMARAVRDLPAFVARGSALGSRHRGYGVRGPHYAFAAEPLFASLAEALDQEWTEDVSGAWRRTYALVSEVMLQGAAGSRT